MAGRRPSDNNIHMGHAVADHRRMTKPEYLEVGLTKAVNKIMELELGIGCWLRQRPTQGISEPSDSVAVAGGVVSVR